VANKCPECSLDNKPDANFCEGCGYTLKSFSEEDYSLKILSDGFLLKDRYIIKTTIKVSRTGAIYKALDKNSGELCVVKELWSSGAMSEDEKKYLVDKFEVEGKLLFVLDYLRFPKLVDYFISNERHYLIIEFIDGENLNNIIARYGNPGLPRDQVLKWAIQICDNLEYLHTLDPPVIYRDLKPSNMVVRTSDNNLFFIDFGIAAYSLQEDLSGKINNVIGTMGYISPEQFSGEAEKASDIYSLGVNLYYLLTGSLPVPSDYKPVCSIVPDVSEKIDVIIRRSMESRPGNRFPSAVEMKMELEKALKPDFLNTKKLSEIDMWTGYLRSAKDDRAKLEAINMLEGLADSRVTGVLLDLLINDNSSYIRQYVASSLGKLKDPICIETLIEKTRDTNPGVSKACMETLTKFDDQRAFQGLINCLRDRDGEIRKNAAIALEESGDVRAIDALVEARSKEGIFSIGLKRIFTKAIDRLRFLKEGDAKEEISIKWSAPGNVVEEIVKKPLEDDTISESDFSTTELSKKEIIVGEGLSPSSLPLDEVTKDSPSPFDDIEDFEYEQKDLIYLRLFYELLNKDVTATAPVIFMNRKKLDERFFRILNYEYNIAMEKDKKKAEDISYLIKVMDNLKVREHIPAPYVPEPGELEELLESSEVKKFPAYSKAVSEKKVLSGKVKEDLNEVRKKVQLYKNIVAEEVMNEPETIDEVIVYYKEIKQAYPEYDFVLDALAWAFMKKGLVEEALRELIKVMEPYGIDGDKFFCRLFPQGKYATRQLTEEERETVLVKGISEPTLEPHEKPATSPYSDEAVIAFAPSEESDTHLSVEVVTDFVLPESQGAVCHEEQVTAFTPSEEVKDKLIFSRSLDRAEGFFPNRKFTPFTSLKQPDKGFETRKLITFEIPEKPRGPIVKRRFNSDSAEEIKDAFLEEGRLIVFEEPEEFPGPGIEDNPGLHKTENSIPEEDFIDFSGKIQEEEKSFLKEDVLKANGEIAEGEDSFLEEDIFEFPEEVSGGENSFLEEDIFEFPEEVSGGESSFLEEDILDFSVISEGLDNSFLDDGFLESSQDMAEAESSFLEEDFLDFSEDSEDSDRSFLEEDFLDFSENSENSDAFLLDEDFLDFPEDSESSDVSFLNEDFLDFPDETVKSPVYSLKNDTTKTIKKVTSLKKSKKKKVVAQKFELDKKTMKRLKKKLSSKKLKALEPFVNNKFSKTGMTGDLQKLNFTKEEIDMVLSFITKKKKTGNGKKDSPELSKKKKKKEVK